jgi:acyl dehydratase
MEQGQTYTHAFSFSQQEVNRFAALTGDNNPLHLDADYAATTPFKRPIMHGFLGGTIFSKVLGTIFPGEGSVYLKQTMEFVSPMFVEVPYEAIFTVKEILPNSMALIETQVVDKATRTVAITGEAMVKSKKIKRIKPTSAG